MNREDIVKEYWKCFDDARFDDLTKLLSADCNVVWPNTREIFKGRDKFIEANKDYPGRWHVELEKIIETPNPVITIARVYAREPGITLYAISFFTIKDGSINNIEEYWGENGPPPLWRLTSKYSVRY